MKTSLIKAFKHERQNAFQLKPAILSSAFNSQSCLKFSFPRPLKSFLTQITLYFKAIMDIYTDEKGFKCQELLQDLKVGISYHFLTFRIVVHCLHIYGTMQSSNSRTRLPLLTDRMV